MEFIVACFPIDFKPKSLSITVLFTPLLKKYGSHFQRNANIVVFISFIMDLRLISRILEWIDRYGNVNVKDHHFPK